VLRRAKKRRSGSQREAGSQVAQLLRYYCNAPQAKIDAYLEGTNWYGGRCGSRPACISQNVTVQDTVPRCFETAVTLGAGFCAGTTIRFSTCDFGQAAADARAEASLQVRAAPGPSPHAMMDHGQASLAPRTC
jgi:hypothetical protein